MAEITESKLESDASAKDLKKKFVPESPVIRGHSMKIDGLDTPYETQVGRIGLKDDKDEIEAQIFYVYYKKTEADSSRPILFIFNGGPGSPAIWLHLGVGGPKRIAMKNDGDMPAPPFNIEDNPHHWFGLADLVFIDPVGTGYSEATNEKIGEKYWSVKGDVDSLCEFIRLFLGKEKRFNSPILIAGESYGTTRGAAITCKLIETGIIVSGLVLVSVAMSFLTLDDYAQNDLPFFLFLPTFAATAWYHNKIDRVKYPDLRPFLHEVEAFAYGEYASALLQGNRLSAENQDLIAKKLSEYCGINEVFIHQNFLRIEIGRFCKELLREDGITVGRLDSRIKGREADSGADRMENDPSMTAIMGPYTMTLQNYLRDDLGYESEAKYNIFHGITKPWKWDMPESGPPDTSRQLEKALMLQPYLQVLVTSGLYDLATPYKATEYTFDHLRLKSSETSRILIKEYEAGHMMYTHDGCLEQMTSDLVNWAKSTEIVK